MEDLESHSNWAEVVRLRDEVSLAELAALVGATPGEVAAALTRSGALAANDDKGALPPEPGDDQAKAFREVRPGSKDALIVAHAGLLGQVPDSELAERAGVSVRTVASFRARHGIPGYRGPRRTGGARGFRKSRIDPHADLLGRVPDRVVAERANVSLNAVRNYRVKRGISAVGHRADPVVVATTGSEQAWRVRWQVGGAERAAVVIASDLATAITRAESAGLGAVVGVELIGAVFEG